jgi:hypothetical protein
VTAETHGSVHEDAPTFRRQERTDLFDEDGDVAGVIARQIPYSDSARASSSVNG